MFRAKARKWATDMIAPGTGTNDDGELGGYPPTMITPYIHILVVHAAAIVIL